jgi:hypothetical protein
LAQADQNACVVFIVPATRSNSQINTTRRPKWKGDACHFAYIDNTQHKPSPSIALRHATKITNGAHHSGTQERHPLYLQGRCLFLQSARLLRARSLGRGAGPSISLLLPAAVRPM